MLKNLKFRHKMILLPVLAGIGFLLVLALLARSAQKNELLMPRIEAGHFAALELGPTLTLALALGLVLLLLSLGVSAAASMARALAESLDG